MIVKLPEMMTQGLIKQRACLPNQWDTPDLSITKEQNLNTIIQ